MSSSCIYQNKFEDRWSVTRINSGLRIINYETEGEKEIRPAFEHDSHRERDDGAEGGGQEPDGAVPAEPVLLDRYGS